MWVKSRKRQAKRSERPNEGAAVEGAAVEGAAVKQRWWNLAGKTGVTAAACNSRAVMKAPANSSNGLF
jgi:hypothetical protein